MWTKLKLNYIKISLISWAGFQETILIIINVEKTIFLWNQQKH